MVLHHKSRTYGHLLLLPMFPVDWLPVTGCPLCWHQPLGHAIIECLETGPDACSIHTTVTKTLGRENGGHLKDRLLLDEAIRYIRLFCWVLRRSVANHQGIVREFYILWLIYDAVHNAMTSQQCNTNPYCMVVLHACIHSEAVLPAAS